MISDGTTLMLFSQPWICTFNLRENWVRTRKCRRMLEDLIFFSMFYMLELGDQMSIYYFRDDWGII